jgi:hypothetical protein
LVGAGLLATLFGWWFVRGSQEYAQKNPAQAMLEGAELLEWQKMDMAAKGIGTLPSSAPIEGYLTGKIGGAK